MCYTNGLRTAVLDGGLTLGIFIYPQNTIITIQNEELYLNQNF